MSSYIIHCRVSGGVTGTRESYMKEDDKLKLFETLEDCEAECERLNRTMGQHSPASFSYSPKEQSQ